MSNDLIDRKVRKHFDALFSDVGPSQQLFELKEELATNMKEKIADYKSRGMDDEQAFKEAVISMGDLRGLVEDMRIIGQEKAKLSVYTTMTARISTAGIIAGVLLVLFGIFSATMLYFMPQDALAITGNGIFIVAGGTLFTYSLLTRETSKKYAMNKIRAGLYALSIGLLLFAVFTGIASRYSTGEMYIAVASLMVFSLMGVGLFLFLMLTGTDRRKNK